METRDIDRQPRDILLYWFGELVDGWTTDERDSLWFGGLGKDDADMGKKFGGMITRALNGELESWRDSADGLMGYILLLDQMIRAVNRGTAAAFDGDKKALAACKSAIDAGIDLQLPAAHCCFFYLPLEHSENIDDQRQCVACFEALSERFSKYKKEFAGGLIYAQQHLDIIRQFGRFPYRNAALGRTSNASEIQYLQDGGVSFGQ